jgi:hypothetical protein
VSSMALTQKSSMLVICLGCMLLAAQAFVVPVSNAPSTWRHSLTTKRNSGAIAEDVAAETRTWPPIPVKNAGTLGKPKSPFAEPQVLGKTSPRLLTVLKLCEYSTECAVSALAVIHPQQAPSVCKHQK